jgi:hypothetical protein
MVSVSDEILKGLPPEQNGVIHFSGINPSGKGLSHIFSFTFYFVPKENSTNHLKNLSETKYYKGLKAYIDMVHSPDFAFKAGVVIYTDAFTKPLLEELFPMIEYPNLILAVVEWAYFTNETGNVDRTIMRIFRYQAVQHFTSQNVHMRDADTLFAVYLSDSESLQEYHKSQKEFSQFIVDWESAYLQFLPRISSLGKQIVFGANDEYTPVYHQNILYPSIFRYSINKMSPSERKKIKFTFSMVGVFAGFVSVLENRDGIEEFWKLCIQYIIKRYVMIEHPETKKMITINQLYSAPSPEGGRVPYGIGKDERMLLWGVIPSYLPKCYFMKVEYSEKRTYPFYNPSYFKELSVSNSLYKYVVSQLEDYKEWVENFYTLFPTEEDFILFMKKKQTQGGARTRRKQKSQKKKTRRVVR